MIKNEILKCEICGNIVFKIHNGDGKMSCCNEEMHSIVANTMDASQEKHVPIIEDCGLTKADRKMKLVKIGSVPHPMQEDHYVEWVGMFNERKATFHWLKPGYKPETTIRIDDNSEVAEYCNIHGLWKTTK